MPWAGSALSAAIPLGTFTKRADFLKEQKSRSVRVFLKTPFRPCPLGCGRFLSSVDSHDRCLQCLGIQRAEAAFVDGLCVRSERVTMAALRSCLSLLTGPAHLLVPSPRGEMIGSSARAVARDHALPWFLSSRKCTRSD